MLETLIGANAMRRSIERNTPMTDIPTVARRIAESMTEAQRIDLIAQLCEIYIRAIQPIDYTKQQCAPAPDWMHQQCRNIHH